jgi:hypothetical protein
LEKLREENSQLRRQVEFLQGQALARSSNTAAPSPVALVTRTNPATETPETGRTAASTATSDRAAAVSTLNGARKHVVRDRETFASIARLYKLRTEAVMAANPSIAPTRLRSGQTLTIPTS